VDYDETFAPVAKLSSLCAILALAAEFNWEVHQMDVKSAYLNRELEEDIFMERDFVSCWQYCMLHEEILDSCMRPSQADDVAHQQSIVTMVS